MLPFPQHVTSSGQICNWRETKRRNTADATRTTMEAQEIVEDPYNDDHRL
jgi:hypothetical protein